MVGERNWSPSSSTLKAAPLPGTESIAAFLKQQGNPARQMRHHALAASVVCLMVVAVVVSCASSHAASRGPQPRPGRRIAAASKGNIHVWADRGVSPRLATSVLNQLTRASDSVDRDFRVRAAPLRVQLFASHSSFARALWTRERERPQSDQDDTANVYHGVLLLRPTPSAYLRHNLIHVYAEWVLDRLTGNRNDVLPADPWLYDGMAEYEAYRYAPDALPCRVGHDPPFDLTAVRTARQWLALRAGPLGSLEYCLAYTRVHSLVARVGWGSIVRALHIGGSWTLFARRVAPLG